MTPDGPHGPAGPVAVAWDWVDHLRAGGTTPWRAFRDAHPEVVLPVSADRGRLPGAAQLELVRLLADRAPQRPGLDLYSLSGVLDRALARSGPGRGLAELPLDLTGQPAPRIGAPPTDPADVPTGELVRVGVGLLVDELLRAEQPGGPGAPAAAGAPRHRRRPFGRRFRVAGAPVTAAAVRSDLAAAGHVAGGRAPEVVLHAAPLEELLGQVWSARVQRGAPVSWEHFVRRWARRDALPPAADLAALAASWADRVGADRVHVVLGPDPRRVTGDLLRLRSRRGARTAAVSAPDLAALPAAGVDLLRRVNEVLGVRLPADRHAALRQAAARALPRLPEATAGPGLGVPDPHRPWAEERAARVVEDLRAGGYPVHGDLDLVAVRTGGPRRARHPEVLDLLLDAVLDVAERAG